MSADTLDLFEPEPALGGSLFEQCVIVIALELAQRAGANGITAADVRLAVARRGMDPPNPGAQRAWSLLAPLLRSLVADGRLVSTGRYRASPIPKSHGNRHLVYVAPTWFQEPR